MPRGPRDYHAEEQRRNERARELGFTSRAQLRGQIEKGVVRRERGAEGTFVYRDRLNRAESKRWSDAHSAKETSKYLPTMTASQAAAYHKAYVAPPASRAARQAAMWDFLVDEMEYYTDDEFDDAEYFG